MAERRNPLDEALANLCEATAEAVEELEAAGDAFDGCPLCGRPAWLHPLEAWTGEAGQP